MVIDDDKCFECDEPMDDMHHVVPKSLGGKRMIPLCLKCHGLVHGKDMLEHRRLQRIGIEKAKKEGKFIGRNKGTIETPEVFLNKSKNKESLLLMEKGYNHTEICEMVGISMNTLTKIKKYSTP